MSFVVGRWICICAVNLTHLLQLSQNSYCEWVRPMFPYVPHFVCDQGT